MTSKSSASCDVQDEEVIFANLATPGCRKRHPPVPQQIVSTAQLVPSLECPRPSARTPQSERRLKCEGHSDQEISHGSKAADGNAQTCSQHRKCPRDPSLRPSLHAFSSLDAQFSAVQGRTLAIITEATASASKTSGSLHFTKPGPDQGAGTSLLGFELFLAKASSRRADGVEMDDSIDKLVSKMVNTMAAHMKDTEALEKYLRALRRLFCDEGACKLQGSYSGIRVVLEALSTFPAHEPLQEQGLLFLIHVCESKEELKLFVGRSGGVRTIISSMCLATQRSPLWLSRCCAALWACCNDCEFNVRAAREVSGIEVVLAAMRTGDSSVELQRHCLQVMRLLVANSFTMQTTLDENGGLQDILAVLRRHRGEEMIHVAGMQLLADILRQRHAARSSLISSGLIDDIEENFRLHSTSSSYIAATSDCIRYLAFDADNRACMATDCMIQLLCDALQAWRDEQNVLLSVLIALGNITCDSDRVKYCVARAGGASLLVMLLSHHRNHAFISEQICRLLRNITDGKHNAKRICARAGAVAALATTMRTLPGVACVQEHSAAALLNLASIQEAALRNANLEGHVKKAIFLHQDRCEAAIQLIYLQQILEQLRNRSSLLRGFFGGSRSISPSNSIARPAAQEVLDEPAVLSAFAALSYDVDRTEY